MARVAAIEAEGRHPDRRRVPRRGHGPDGASRAGRPLGCLGDGAGRDVLLGMADLAVGLPRRAAGRRRPGAVRRTSSAPASRRSATRPIADARAAVDPLVPRDNASTLRANLPIYLTLPSVLARARRAGAGRPGPDPRACPTGRPARSRPMPSRSRRSATGSSARGAGCSRRACRPTPTGPLVSAESRARVLVEALTKPAGDLRRLQRGRRDAPATARIALGPRDDRPEDDRGRIPGAPVIVDLRNNGGGDNTTFGPLREELETIAAAHPGSVR